jgi:hypothetical protein
VLPDGDEMELVERNIFAMPAAHPPPARLPAMSDTAMTASIAAVAAAAAAAAAPPLPLLSRPPPPPPPPQPQPQTTAAVLVDDAADALEIDDTLLALYPSEPSLRPQPSPAAPRAPGPPTDDPIESVSQHGGVRASDPISDESLSMVAALVRVVMGECVRKQMGLTE